MIHPVRGSEWRKWDLHLHSPYNLIKGKGEYTSITDEDFISKIKKENISAIGLTNYIRFVDEDYILKEKLEAEGIVVFLNLELRLTASNKDEKLLDYHIIFDNQLTKKEIETFLANLEIEIGSTSKAANQITKDDINNAAADINHLLATLKKESLHLGNRYISAFLSRGHGHSVGEGKNQIIYETIVRNSDLVLHSSTLIENLRKDKEFWLSGDYIRPVLQSSDGHCIDAIGTECKEVENQHKNKEGVFEKDGKYFVNVANFSWIKSDLTFEGLRQILFEPEDRVYYGSEHPDQKSNYLVIDYLIHNGKQYYLNSNLNAIIGSRSTGKSTLLNSIAKFQNSKNYEKQHIFDGEFSVVWRDGATDKNREIEYIPQEYMIKISDNPKKLNELLETIIEKKGKDKEIIHYRELKAEKERKIKSLLQRYFNHKENLKNLVKPEGDLNGVSKQIEFLKKKVSDIQLNNNFSEEENKKFQENQEKLFDAQEKMKTNNLEHFSLEKLKKNDFRYNVDLSEVNDYNRALLEEILLLIQKSSQQIWENAITNIQFDIEQESLLHNEVRTKCINNTIFKKGYKVIENNEELQRLNKRLDEEIKIQSHLKKYENQKLEIKGELYKLESKIIEEFLGYKVIFEELNGEFKITEDDLEIGIKAKRTDFNDRINYLHGRNQLNNSFIKRFNSIDEYDNEQVQQILRNIFRETELTFNGNKVVDNLIQDVFEQSWYDYDYTIVFQNDEFQSMSQGKKSFVVLKLLLEFSDDKKPVLIDQPEDSLDNRAIYTDLKKYLQRKKKERQVIVVTHNPNVVVGADAENIIVANQDSIQTPNENSLQFDYINGALENTFVKKVKESFTLKKQGIREHVFEILEGGKEAFEKREQKYNLK